MYKQCKTKRTVPVTLVLVSDLLGPLLQHLVSIGPVLTEKKEEEEVEENGKRKEREATGDGGLMAERWQGEENVNC